MPFALHPCTEDGGWLKSGVMERVAPEGLLLVRGVEECEGALHSTSCCVYEEDLDGAGAVGCKSQKMGDLPDTGRV